MPTTGSNKQFAIYGAYGYTGELIARFATQMGLKPILAGRNEQKLVRMSKQYDLPYEVVDLNNETQLNDLCLLVDAVIHCAGPFKHTFKPMLKACMKNGTHYLDITGELEVFEAIAQVSDRIEQTGITAMPGVGFDVVPTDCMAAYLKEKLPTATHLELAFMSIGGGVSHGTANTLIENIDEGGAVRMNGRIMKVPSAHKVKRISFGGKKPVTVVTIPWGDVSTAYYSTGIPNIEVYTAVNKRVLQFMKNANSMGWFLGKSVVKSLLKTVNGSRAAGPSDEQRKKAKSYVFGKVTDEAGNQFSAGLETLEGYTLTALCALHIVKKVLAGDLKIGFQTPSMAYGADLILEIQGSSRKDLNVTRKVDVS